MIELPKNIEEYFLSEYDRKGVFVPSGRFGLYAIARSVFSPGDRVIVSPITCKTVVLALFATGVIPVFVDVDDDTGNIDVQKLNANVLGRVKGIITTNLYGTPDRVKEIRMLCLQYGLFLLEDCAHVVDAHIEGLRVGSIGDASVFSFAKFWNAYGGIVLSANPKLLEDVRKTVQRESQNASRIDALWAGLKSSVFDGIPKGHAIKRFVRDRLSRIQSAVSDGVTREGQQLSYEELSPLDAASLKPLDLFLSESGKPYDKLPTKTAVDGMTSAFMAIDKKLETKRFYNQKLIEICPLERKKSRYDSDYCNLIVPYYLDNRDEIRKKLKTEKGVNVWYVYDPPLTSVFNLNSFVDEQKTPEIAEEWSKHVLPIDSQNAREFLEVIEKTNREQGRGRAEKRDRQI